MPTPRERPLAERLLLAFVLFAFLLQPLATAAGSCALRARLFGSSCCCAAPSAKKSCCEKCESQAPARKSCECQLSAPPLVPPSGPGELSTGLLGELARTLALPGTPCFRLELAHAPPRAHAPPGRASCFHTCLGSGLARALAFERSLRC